ncbi:beta/alpha barrel domain-containing protein [Streptomyces beihaiensis]|uniref:Uncharacterized protein n=1 Tax=Streptomyces beihaiensis TaxID=2984495 RepID=A0ABT3TVP9_9ACTN|nr:hypothetical protein [Streptomyces beihaiensis]MCX3061094.1 hypothetical protein [Streptomyces beihaiensis]
MSTFAPTPTRTTGPLRKATEAGVALWLDCRHTPASGHVAQARAAVDERTCGVLGGAPEGRSPRPGGIPAGLAVTAVATDGTAVVGPVRSVVGYRRIMDVLLADLEALVASGGPLPVSPTVIEYSLSDVDAAVDACLDLAGSWEAKAMRGLAGVAGAHLLYGALRRDLGSARWARLIAAGAQVPYLLWSCGPAVTADRGARLAEKCLFPGTGVALSPAALAEFGERGVVTGPTALDLDEAVRVAKALGWFDVNLNSLSTAGV